MPTTGLRPDHIVGDLVPVQTSRPELRPKGFAEPTATVVWEQIARSGRPPADFVLWNVFPWHPYDPRRGMLSNRRPDRDELRRGLKTLEALAAALNPAVVVAVGRLAAAELHAIGMEAVELRHPAYGGAGAFRRQFAALMGRPTVQDS